jgi:hypothetical protein
VLTKYKKEVKGPLDFSAALEDSHACFGGAHPS